MPRPLGATWIEAEHAFRFALYSKHAVAKIPYLRELDVTAVELMPVVQFDPGTDDSGVTTRCHLSHHIWDTARDLTPDRSSRPWCALHDGIVRPPPDASAAGAAHLMRDRGIHRILITEDDKLLGTVSALDVARAAAAGHFTKRTYVFNRDRDL